MNDFLLSLFPWLAPRPPKPPRKRDGYHGFRLWSPWPDDEAIDINEYKSNDSKHFYLHMQADGPNGDGTLHHAAMGFREFTSRHDMGLFFAALLKAYVERNGQVPILLLNYGYRQDSEDYSGYVLGERKSPGGSGLVAVEKFFRENNGK